MLRIFRDIAAAFDAISLVDFIFHAAADAAATLLRCHFAYSRYALFDAFDVDITLSLICLRFRFSSRHCR